MSARITPAEQPESESVGSQARRRPIDHLGEYMVATQAALDGLVEGKFGADVAVARHADAIVQLDGALVEQFTRRFMAALKVEPQRVRTSCAVGGADQEPSSESPAVCEGCRGSGENWDCEGNNDPDHCQCHGCTGAVDCQECEGRGYYG